MGEAKSFAESLAANDREHVKRLEEIAREADRLTDALYGKPYCGLASIIAESIRREIKRWRRPHPMGSKP